MKKQKKKSSRNRDYLDVTVLTGDFTIGKRYRTLISKVSVK